MVRLEVDHRERSSELFALLRDDPRFDVRVANLSVGDYVVDGRVVVERKTVDDFAASVIDTRLFRQANALQRCSACGVVVLEGTRTAGKPKLGRAQLQGAIITLTMVFGVPLLRCKHRRRRRG